MNKVLVILLFIVASALIAIQFKPVQKVVVNVSSYAKPSLVNEKGLTVKERVKIPEGFTRVTYPEHSFQEYIRNYKLKSFDAKVINYDGSLYFNQIGHFGVLEIPVPKNGLQQCADALIRIRSEYLWDNNQKNKIGFNFTSGDYCSWTKYAQGYRPKINGNKVSFSKTAKTDNSKANFYNYLNLIYTYSGTLSLYHELPKITSTKNLKIGDMLIIGGSPGHVVMIADEIVNDKGEKRFILLQGNTPAQSIHLLKNINDKNISPWYKLPTHSEIDVPGYTFYNSEFVRFKQ